MYRSVSRYLGGSVGFAGCGCVGVGDGRGGVAVGSGALPNGTVPVGGWGVVAPAGGITGPCVADGGASCSGPGAGSVVVFVSGAAIISGAFGSCCSRACASRAW